MDPNVVVAINARPANEHLPVCAVAKESDRKAGMLEFGQPIAKGSLIAVIGPIQSE
jgi:hypothetical protein